MPLTYTYRVNQLLRHNTPDLKYARMLLVCERLGLSKSCLEKYLAAEGTNWHTLVDAERRRRFEDRRYQARRAGEHLTKKEYAREVGYVSGASIRNACLRWYGVSAKHCMD